MCNDLSAFWGDEVTSCDRTTDRVRFQTSCRVRSLQDACLRPAGSGFTPDNGGAAADEAEGVLVEDGGHRLI